MENGYTIDSFYNGGIRVKQHREGYRFSIDAVFLAHYANPRDGDKILDLGTGCGIIPLLIAHRNPTIRVFGIEIQQGLADLASENVKANRMQDRIAIVRADLRSLQPDMISGSVDLVLCNPPYHRAKAGRISPNRQRAIARHEIEADLDDILHTARRMLLRAGRLVIIYPAERTIALLVQMRGVDIEPKTIRAIHPKRDSRAKLIVVEGIKDAKPGLTVAPPAIIYGSGNDYSEGVRRMYDP